jgi:hypothetical protein
MLDWRLFRKSEAITNAEFGIGGDDLLVRAVTHQKQSRKQYQASCRTIPNK